ncbi:MAG: methyltransferase domain-containing protein, partial [Pseudobdellovibrionaceae bacterium]
CFQPGARVLDVGSGIGKFCIVGALTTTGTVFHGVEQRGALVAAAKRVATKYAFPNVMFFQKNALDVDWKKYNAVYLYNPFWENVDKGARIDDSVPLDNALLVDYVKMTKEKLSLLNPGSRAVIFNGYGGTIPKDFRLMHFERIRGLDLTVWQKM